MYQISNRHYEAIIEMLTAYVEGDDRTGTLREQNRYRRARLLIRSLKRKQVSVNNSINNKNK